MSDSEIPGSNKEYLLRLSEPLPPAQRAEFLRCMARRLGPIIEQLMRDYKHTIVCGMLGFIIGQLWEMACTVSVPCHGAVSLTGGSMRYLGAAAGLGIGMYQDFLDRKLMSLVRGQIDALNALKDNS